MTANMSGPLYDRLAESTGVPRHKVKALLYRLAYDGQTVTGPPGPEEFILRSGLQFAQRGIAVKELADWLEKYSFIVAKERPEYQGQAAMSIAHEVIEGAEKFAATMNDRAELMAQVNGLREALSEIQDKVDEALRIGGA